MPIPRVGGLDDPIWAQSAEDEPVAPDGRRVQLIIAVATIGTALLLGYLGWSLPVVGAPLTYPTLIVFGTGVAIGAIGWVIGERRHLGARRALLFPGIAVALAIAGAAWTFEFSLPASVWFSDAGQQAEAALMAAGHAPKDRWGESAVPCNVVRPGGSDLCGRPTKCAPCSRHMRCSSRRSARTAASPIWRWRTTRDTSAMSARGTCGAVGGCTAGRPRRMASLGVPSATDSTVAPKRASSPHPPGTPRTPETVSIGDFERASTRGTQRRDSAY